MDLCGDCLGFMQACSGWLWVCGGRERACSGWLWVCGGGERLVEGFGCGEGECDRREREREMNKKNEKFLAQVKNR